MLYPRLRRKTRRESRVRADKASRRRRQSRRAVHARTFLLRRIGRRARSQKGGGNIHIEVFFAEEIGGRERFVFIVVSHYFTTVFPSNRPT